MMGEKTESEGKDDEQDDDEEDADQMVLLPVTAKIPG